MIATALTFTTGEEALHNGRLVTIQGTKGRWVQIDLGDGTIANVARAALVPMPPLEEDEDEDEDEAATKISYTGPMLALRQRFKLGGYVTAANGNPCCADNLATVCGVYPPAVVVAGLARVNGIGNPYQHLNIGQQSMNLRNKIRGMLKNGTVTIDEVRAHLEAAAQEVTA